MNRIIYKSLAILIVSISIFSCKQHHKIKLHKIHVYKSKRSELHADSINQSNDDILWYVMWSNNSDGGTNYYYTSSPTKITNFTSINWIGSSKPPAIEDEEEVQTIEIPMTELPTEIQTEITDNESEIAESVESGANTVAPDNESSETDADADSDSGSSSAGDSGGDSGGGDGGD